MLEELCRWSQAGESVIKIHPILFDYQPELSEALPRLRRELSIFNFFQAGMHINVPGVSDPLIPPSPQAMPEVHGKEHWKSNISRQKL